MKQNASRRRWLILSHGFNMDGRAASLTVTDKMAHLVAAGIEPVVLSAVTGTQDTHFRHHRLLPWGPSGLRFDLRHLIAMHFGRGVRYRLLTLLASLLLAPFMLVERALLGLRNQWSWAPAAFFRAAWLLRHGDIELVYTSGGAYSAHLAGWWLKRWLNVTWIAEIHDPMVFPGRPLRNRDDRFQARLESRICNHADLVWWFTDGALAAARSRNPALGERGIVVIPGAEPPLRHTNYTRGPRCVVGHFGSLSAQRSLAPFLHALNAVLARRPAWRDIVRLEVYGSDVDPEARRLITTLDLSGVVQPMGRLEFDGKTGMSGRERVIQRMQQVDVLLLLHGDTAECAQYIPSKLYDYFWTRRPVLALTHLNPQLDAMVIEHDGWVAPTTDIAAAERVLDSVLEAWQHAQLDDVERPPPTVGKAVGEIVAAVTTRLDPALRSAS